MRNGFGLVLFLVGPALYADVTLTYKSDIQLADFLPPAAKEQFKKATDGKFPAGQSIRMKATKAYSDGGGFQCIVDFAKGELTLLDPAHKRFTTLPAGQFTDKLNAAMPQLPEEARKAMEAVKLTFDSRETGRTDTIHGIQAVEREAVLAMEMTPPGKDQPLSIMKMVIRIWTAKPEEALRVPAIRELTAYNLWTGYLINPTGQAGKFLAAIPGAGDGLGRLAAQVSENKAVMLRMYTEVYTPVVGQMQGEELPGFDPNTPMVRITQEVSELSTASVEDAAFQVPEGFQAIPVDEIMKGISEAQLLK